MRRRAQQFVSVTFLAALAVTVPKILVYTYVLQYDEDGLPIGTATHHEKSRSDYLRWSDIALFAVIPLLGVIVPLNSAIAILLNGKGLSKNDRSTRMIVAVVATFVALKLPMTLSVLLGVANVLPSRPELIFTFLSRDLTIVNSAVNFLIYFAAGREFRRHLRKTFCTGSLATRSNSVAVIYHSSISRSSTL